MVHVDALKGDNGGRRVKKVEVAPLREQPGDGLGQGVGGQRPGGNDHLPLGDGRDLPLLNSDIGMASDGGGGGDGKPLPVHGQGAPRLHPRLIRTAQDQRAAPAQLLLEQAHGVLQLIGAQGVGAHQLGKAGAVVGGGHFAGLHLAQRDGNPPLGQLPGALAPGQARADDGYTHRHRPLPRFT